MHTRQPVAIFIASVALLAAILAYSTAREKPAAGPPRNNPVEDKTQPARNPERLTLLVDSEKVLGWVSGSDDCVGQMVTVKQGGSTISVPIENGNTFTYPYSVKKPARARFTVGRLNQSVMLRPPVKLGPCAFFVTDRSVYRPKQTLHFAAYLREPDVRGELAPLANRPVEVRLTSDQKKTVAATLKLTSDAHGRINGQYAFIDADVLDDYTLSINGYKGAARLALAEYRKSKVHLKITGQPEGDRLRLRFEAVDYLQRAAPGGRVQFTSHLIRNPAAPKSSPLRTEDFAYADAEPTGGLRLEDLSDDEQLLCQVDPTFDPVGVTVGEVVATTEGATVLDGKAGEFVLNLPPGWRQARHAVVVQGILLDATGREVRRTQTIPLDRVDSDIRLALDKAVYEPDEPIHVLANGFNGKAVLVAMRLSAATSGAAWGVWGPLDFNISKKPGTWQMMPTAEPVVRALTTATPFDGKALTLRLSEPGAYKLIAVVDRPGGAKQRQEIGCVVQPRDERPALRLQMARDAVSAGEELRGIVHGRFTDARVLLTLRDGQGYRAWRVVKLTGGSVKFTLPLPKGIGYGCAVEAQYADAPTGPAHVASHLLHVEPADRMLTVSAKAPDFCAPGQTVTVDVDVNRKEAVDLVVSVYDQALAGIRAEEAVDPRAFFHADDSAHRSQTRELLWRRLGGMKVVDLLNLERDLKSDDASRSVAWVQLDGPDGSPALISATVASLLRLAGVSARVQLHTTGNWYCPRSKAKQMSVLELLESDWDGWRLHVSLLHDTFILTEQHSTEQPQAWVRRPRF